VDLCRAALIAAISIATGVRAFAAPDSLVTTDSAALEGDGLDAVERDRLLEEWDGDVAALAAAEDLALDPVRVGSDDVERLAVLPWVDGAALDALRAARDATSIDDVARLPGWSRAMAQRVAPFVVFAPRRARAGALHVQRTRGAWRARGDAAGVSAALRAADTPEARAVAGWARIAHGPYAAWAGDLRLGHGQGLVLATASQSGTLPVARGAGVSGTASASRTRVVRGAGAALGARRLRTTVVHGTLRDTTTCTAIATTLILDSAWQLHATALANGATRTASAGCTRARGATAFAFEVTSAPAAVAAGASWRGPTTQLAVRTLVSPGALASPLTAAPRAAARDAAIAYTWSTAKLDATFEVAHTARRDASETRRTVLHARTTWRGNQHRITTHIALQSTRREGIETEAPLVLAPRTDVTGTIAVERRLDARWWGGLQLRAGARNADSLTTASTWHAWIERRSPRLRPYAAIASHAGTTPGLGAGPSGGLAMPALRGDAVRVTLQLRVQAGPVQLRTGGCTTWESGGRSRTAADAAVALDLRL